jgi:hypothetical protein
MEAKLTRLTYKIAIQLHLVAESWNHLQISLQAASPETFGYTFPKKKKKSPASTCDGNPFLKHYILDNSEEYSDFPLERLTARVSLVTQCIKILYFISVYIILSIDITFTELFEWRT